MQNVLKQSFQLQVLIKNYLDSSQRFDAEAFYLSQ